MKRKKIIFKTAGIALAAVIPLLSCGFLTSPEEIEKEIEKSLNPKFFSDENPGKWSDQAGSHIPIITVKSDDKFKHIKVTVPFKGKRNPLHYVEAIILTDHNGKELQKTEFELGAERAEADFKLPASYRSYIFVVVKCNLHDMWQKRIDW